MDPYIIRTRDGAEFTTHASDIAVALQAWRFTHAGEYSVADVISISEA